jgi:hypothetical protein
MLLQIFTGDFIVSNGVGVKNSLMLGYLFDLQPEARKLYHFMKAFLPRYDLKFEGYFLKLLVIFYLQKEMFLPSIERVQDKLAENKINGEKNVEKYLKNIFQNYLNVLLNV